MDLIIGLKIVGKKLGMLGVSAQKIYADVDALPNIGETLYEGIAKNGSLLVTNKYLDYSMNECYIDVNDITDDTHTIDEVKNYLCKPHGWSIVGE